MDTTTATEMIVAFWPAFFAELFAGFLLLVLGTFFLPPYLEWRQRPKLKLFDTKSGDQDFKWSERADKKFETTLHLSIQNMGKSTLDSFYWEIYIEKDIAIATPAAVTHPDDFPIERREGDKFLRLYGYIKRPLFSMDEIEFPYQLKLLSSSRRTLKIPYFFRTSWGARPYWGFLGPNRGWFFLLPHIKID
jgi:hypothetical protein